LSEVWLLNFLRLFFPKYGNIKNVPNHQPVLKTQFLAEFIIVGCWFLVNVNITLIQPKSSTSHGCSPNWKSTWDLTWLSDGWETLSISLGCIYIVYMDTLRFWFPS
jgi:hypothetical protein